MKRTQVIQKLIRLIVSLTIGSMAMLLSFAVHAQNLVMDLSGPCLYDKETLVRTEIGTTTMNFSTPTKSTDDEKIAMCAQECQNITAKKTILRPTKGCPGTSLFYRPYDEDEWRTEFQVEKCTCRLENSAAK